MTDIIRRAVLATAIATTAKAATITYEDADLGSQGYLNHVAYAAAGVTHSNSYNSVWKSWNGFAVSNQTDTATPGWGNQYSSYAGSAAGGSKFAVGYVASPTSTRLVFATPTSMAGKGADITNITYAALDMLGGSGFSKKFGGPTGNDPDWLLLTLTGYLNQTATSSVDMYLADFRDPDNSKDSILNTWKHLDFTPLGTVDEIRFTMTSTDNGDYGMNTPAYFAMDNLVVPEPSTGGLAALGGLLMFRRRRTERQIKTAS